MTDLWTALRTQPLRRDPANGWFGGVAAGLARRLDVDPLIVRAAFVLIAIFGGFGIVLYLAAWLALPNDRDEVLLQKAVTGQDAVAMALLAVLAVTVIGSLGLSNGRLAIGWWVLALVGFLWWRNRRGGSASSAGGASAEHPQSTFSHPSTPPPPPAGAPTSSPISTPTSTPASFTAPGDAASGRSTMGYPGPVAPSTGYPTPFVGHEAPRGFTGQPAAPGVDPSGPGAVMVAARPKASGHSVLIALGLTLIAGTVGALLDGTGALGAPLMLAFPLVVLAAFTLWHGLRGRRAGLPAVLTAVLIPITAVSMIVPSAGTLGASSAVGDQQWAPSGSERDFTYQLAAGDAVLDLAGFASTGTTQWVTVEMGVGDLTVLVPSGVAAEVRTDPGLGDLLRRGTGEDQTISRMGSGARVRTSPEIATDRVIVHVKLGAGDVTVQEQP